MVGNVDSDGKGDNMAKSFKVNSSIFYAPKLTTNDKIIYIYLCGIAKDNKAMVSRREIAKRCSIAKQSAINSLVRLEKYKFVATNKHDVHGIYRTGLLHLTNTYTIVRPDFKYSDMAENKIKEVVKSGELNLRQYDGIRRKCDDKKGV